MFCFVAIKVLIYNLQFSQPRFGLKRKEYSNRTLYKAEIDAFRKYMHNVVVLFAGQKVNRKELQARLDEMFELESKLTLVSGGRMSF